MSESNYRVRRATVDDLKELTSIWAAMKYPVADLERRLTEFQIVETSDGRLLGALGMEMAGRYGRMHSEGFTDFGLADSLRPKLWERMQSVANNHGLVRVWIQETAPFWNRNGLDPANAETLKKLPAAWSTFPGLWLTIQLRDEAAVELSLDKELAKFMEFEKARTAQAMRQARVLKFIAGVVAVLLAIAVGVVSFYVLKHRALLQGH
jgi:hypothetical protein